MLEKNKTQNPIEVVCIPNTLEKSLQGKYFIGQTETLIIGQDLNAWGGLINPEHSGVNLFNTVVTITNFSETSFLAQFWFNSTPPGTGTVSDQVSPSNTSLFPLPKPKVELQFVQSVSGTPTGGVNIYNRLVPPKATLVSEEDGKLIFSSQGTFVIYLVSPGPELIQARIAFGWMEEKC